MSAEAQGGLDGLVNNAGVSIPGPLETLSIDDFRRQVEVLGRSRAEHATLLRP